MAEAPKDDGPKLSAEDRIAALETRVELLIAELRRHITLRDIDPPELAPPSNDPPPGL